MTTLTAPQTSTTTWNIDPAHAVAEFKVKHMMISNVKGQFHKVTGSLTLDQSNLANSRVEAVIDAASLETRDAQRNGHLKSADFLDVVQKVPAYRGATAPKDFNVAVRDGIATISGAPQADDLTRAIIEAVRHVQGVVAVRDRFSAPGSD